MYYDTSDRIINVSKKLKTPSIIAIFNSDNFQSSVHELDSVDLRLLSPLHVNFAEINHNLWLCAEQTQVGLRWCWQLLAGDWQTRWHR